MLKPMFAGLVALASPLVGFTQEQLMPARGPVAAKAEPIWRAPRRAATRLSTAMGSAAWLRNRTQLVHSRPNGQAAEPKLRSWSDRTAGPPNPARS